MPQTHDILTIQEQIIEDFNFLEQWEDKYQYLIEKGDTLDDFEAQWQTEQNRVKGCQSQVWLVMRSEPDSPDTSNPLMEIQATSDAAIVRGLLALIIEVYNHQSAKTIVNAPLDFINRTGLVDHLSPNRKNGLAAMLKQIRQHANNAIT